MSASIQQLVTFNLDAQRFALHLRTVARVVAIAEITPLPAAPEVVLGIVNIAGEIVPVIDIRKRFGLPAREIKLSDQMLIARTSRRVVALVADGAVGVVSRPKATVVAADGISPDLKYVAGVVQLKDGLTLIHDLETFFSAAEEQVLEQAMAAT